MSEIIVRSAQRADMEAVHGLIKGLAIFEKAGDEVTVTSAQLEEDGFDKGLFKAFVAEEGGALIGFALCYPRYSTWKGHTLYLEDFYVEEAHRRSGLGFKLFDAVAKLAKEMKAKRLEWQVLEWNEPAISFYTKKLNAELSKEWINCTLDEKRISEW
ncbi:N-acetyltransferase ats1 [Diplonema papillatum]|nr:N-acetyltransferase ats1 [Diplonema papillatum]|eukprot:gene15664-23912_t